MAVLITVATGTNGPEIVKQSLARGIQVRALVRNEAKARSVLPPETELINGDYTDPVAARTAMKGIERVLILTAVHEHMANHEETLISAACEAHVSHVVLFSAIGAHPGSRSFFARAHGRAEGALVRSGLAFSILQPSFFMQNLFWAAPTIIDQAAIYNADGNGAASHVDASDIAAVAAAVLSEPIQDHAGEIYVITGPERLTYTDIAAKASTVFGRTVKYVPLSGDAYKQTMIQQSGMPEWLAQAIVELDIRCRGGDFSSVTDVVERVGHRSPTTLEQFLRAHRERFDR